MKDVRVQQGDFDVSAELASLRAQDPRIGAVVSFVGTVRDMNDGASVSEMELEHYPGMTEQALANIFEQARARWPLLGVTVIHRHGRLLPGDNIVLVATASSHREAAFAAAEFLMDYLKTRAPFWKKEETSAGARWVEARASDDDAAARWRAPTEPAG